MTLMAPSAAVRPSVRPSIPLPTLAPKDRLWLPKRAVFTRSAMRHAHGNAVYDRLRSFGLEPTVLKADTLPRLDAATDAEAYRVAKQTLVVSVQPKSALKLQPIPPSADYQFHLAEGCPAHCSYCYLAGSLKGHPYVRAFANLDEILANAATYVGVQPTTFEVSCYTDPLGLEHVTGSLSKTIAYFGNLPNGRIRFVSKYSGVDPLLDVAHHGHTRARVSLNAADMARKFEGGTATVAQRLSALRRLRDAGYDVGVIVAPILPFDGWREQYDALLHAIHAEVGDTPGMSFELITHRFTPASKQQILSWYPNTTLDLSEEGRRLQTGKFGSRKYVLKKETVAELKPFLMEWVRGLFPSAHVQYWV